MVGSCVRVDPPLVEFKNARGGEVYETVLAVTNIGKSVKKIVFTKPTLKVFQLDPPCGAVSLASGLSVSVSLKFSPESDEEIRDCVQVHVDDEETISIPLLVPPRVCLLSMDSSIDFGCVAASSEVIVKHHPITNHGSAPGMFRIQCDGRDAQLSLSPHRGVVAAGATKWLKVELNTDRPKQISEQFLVELQNGPVVVLSISAEVVEQRLEVSDLQGRPLPCLEFGCVYFGTSHVKEAVLRNRGPAACDWVCLLQETAAGTELGTDLQRSTDAALLEEMRKCSSANDDVRQTLVCVPDQGRLSPNDKTTLSLCFSPVYSRNAGQRARDLSPRRQDYCLFLLFDSVGRRHGFTHGAARSSVEVAVTGSGLPVRLVPSPSHRFDFPSCAPGQRADVLCVLQNLCQQLPVTFRFRKLAQFSAEPSGATVGPGQRLDVVLTFKARQHGSFCGRQKLDVQGRVSSRNEDQEVDLKLCSFHTITLHLSATCKMQSAGLQRPIHNCELEDQQLKRCQTETSSSSRDGESALHHHSPAPAIRMPSPHRETSRRSMGSGVPPCRSVDNQHLLSEEDSERRRQHRQTYVDFIRRRRQTRLHQIKEREQKSLEDGVDIGIVPCHGLLPPKLHPEENETSEPRLKASLLSGSKRSFSLDTESRLQPSEMTNAVPSTSQQEEDCSRTLTPQELYRVIVEPRLLDFGRVCVDSQCVQTLTLINLLPAHVWLNLEVDCPELGGSAPLSHILPPLSHQSFPLVFESSAPGSFCRPLTYSVNQSHPGQIVVQAQVIPLSLELSTTLLALPPTPTVLAAAGHRSAVTLRNPCNRAAEFTWRPIVTQNDFPFSVRPATGTVRPLSELDCEVVWRPSFSSSSEGDLEVFVHEGNTQQLHCVAKLGSTSVQPAQDRITFGSVPLNAPSVRIAVLHNSGQNHAYYKVAEEHLPAGMAVSPGEGVIPSKGQAALQIRYSPEQVARLDARVEISLRNMKSVELRVVGTVEPPNVDVSVTHFQFHGVYVGSQQRIPFSLTNRSATTARVAFHLPDHKDFFVQVPPPPPSTSSHQQHRTDPGLNGVEIQAGQTEECSLVFSPTQVASHEFHLHLNVNGIHWPPSSPTPPSSSSRTARGRSLIKAPCRSDSLEAAPLIHATALPPPLEMSPNALEFHLDPQSHLSSQTVELKAASRDGVCWSLIGYPVCWWFDCRVAAGLLSVSPSSGSLEPDQSVHVVVTVHPEVLPAGTRGTKASILLYLGPQQEVKGQSPYRRLLVTVTFNLPTISLQPRRVLVGPAPLRSSVETRLTLKLDGYPSGTKVSAEVDEVELEDGTKSRPFSVAFPEGNTVPAQNHKQEASAASLTCTVTFSSAVRVCLRTNITFTDHMHNRFSFEVCAAADNSLLTLWPYLALHHWNQRVVVKIEDPTVTAFLQSVSSPSSASGPSALSSSSFHHSSSANQSSDGGGSTESVGGDASAPQFAAADTEEGAFERSVLVAVERWFSLFGWPAGPHPVTVPHTLRRVSLDAQSSGADGGSRRVNQNRDTRSFVDMLQHLSGRQIPGVPVCRSLSDDVERRVQELLRRHQAALSFLTVQGACLSHIRPQDLLDEQEFEHWCLLQAGSWHQGLDCRGAEYESLSRRSWTDVLLQTYKVLVLRRVSVGCQTSPLDHSEAAGLLFSSYPSVQSNVYSSQELLLLFWLNTHYHRMRGSPWAAGGTAHTPARWIVNFDLDFTDGLVLASLLAAHCPYLIKGFLSRTYADPSSLEEIFHNNLLVVQVLSRLHLSMNVQPTDLCQPNPVQVLMLCAHLYEALPQFLPKDTISLSGNLHGTLSKQVRLTNPSSKTIRYQASLFGEDARWFSFPAGSKVIVPPKSSAELTVQSSCLCLRQMQAVLVLICSSASDVCSLAFSLRTRVSHISPTSTLTCESPCYQLRRIRLPLTNSFQTEAHFRVVLVESSFNPLESESGIDSIVHQATRTADGTAEGGMQDGAEGDFLSEARSVSLKASQEDSLNVLYMPFFPGKKHLCVLLLCPQVGDMVHLVKATSQLPLPSPLSVRTSSPLALRTPVVNLHCRVGDLLEEVLQIPRINLQWEQALAVWAQHCMSEDEQRRRQLTHTLQSSTVRTSMAFMKTCRQSVQLWRQIYQEKQIEYRVEVSLPRYFVLPSSVSIPVKEDADAPWDDSTDCVNVPLRFRADSVGQFTCQMVMESCLDTRLYLLEVLVTAQGGVSHLEFSSPVRRSLTQHIPVYNGTQQNWRMEAVVRGEGFSGPNLLHVQSGTQESYPLTFLPAAPGVVTGKLSLQGGCADSERVFALRGVGGPPVPEDHVVLHCPVGRTSHTQLDIPNPSRTPVTLKVVTDLPIVSGKPRLVIKPGDVSPYTLTVSPWKRGKGSD
ncbi:cilia- and flagella-associated protein 47 isoform X2 [Oryzias latipes]|uniref:cilia- and flagella-associated protein 47 isoform X2 n=1 Tax=Oryzias latipes TaxID=8090 RepID=UPI0009DB4DCB|nr:cilia- and flagella-associated protein 47 isoform X2 [Oryzias latipes]